MYNGFSISLVVPCYNEEEGLKKLLSQNLNFIDEFIVVDNNSSDGTSQIGKEGGALVVLAKSKGYGNAIKTGLCKAGCDIICTLDGDATYPASVIPNVLDFIIKEDLDFVSCRRFPLTNKNAMSKRNVLGNKVLTVVTNILFGLELYDSQSGMWVFKRDILTKIPLTSNGMAFSEEIKIESFLAKDIKASEYHIIYSERIGDTKLYPYKDGIKNLFFLFKRRYGKINRKPFLKLK